MGKFFGVFVMVGFQFVQVVVGDMYDRFVQVRYEVVFNVGSDWWFLGGLIFLLREGFNGDWVFFNLFGGYCQVRMEDIIEMFISLLDLKYWENFYWFIGEGGWMIMLGICVEVFFFGLVSLQVFVNYIYVEVKQWVEWLNVFGLIRLLVYF